MNTLDELRDTLEQHAAGVTDTERLVRAGSVRTRARKVRQRRLGAVAVTAAVAAVLAIGGVGLVRDGGTPEPAGPLFGDVPDRVEVYGFPYEVSSMKQVDDGGTLEIDPDESHVVSLVATGVGDGAATLSMVPVPDYSFALARVRGDEQVSAPVEVEAGIETLQVRLDGAPAGARIGVVVYGPTGELATGASAPGVVFRQRFPGYTLEDADFGDPSGEVEVTSQRGDEHTLAQYCRATRPDLWIHFVLDTGLEYADKCADYDWDDNDPGPNAGYLNDGRQGAFRVSAYVTSGEHGQRVTDVPFGLAVYRDDTREEEVLGDAVAPRELEFGGRTWRLDETRTMDGTEQTFDIDTSDGDVFFGFVVRADDSRFTWHGELDPGDMRGGGATGNGPQPADWGQGGILFAGDHYEIDAQLFGKDAEGAITLYRPE